MNKKKLGFMTSFASVLLLLVVFMVSCASYKSGSEVGKYYFDNSGNEYNLTLEEEGKLSLNKDGSELTGSYSIDGDVIKIKLSDKTKLEGTYKDGIVSFNYDNVDMKFIRDIEYTVTFDSNGGSAVKSVKVKNGRTVAKPTDPERVQHAFVGWTTAKDGNDLFSFNDTKITKDLTVYAKWSYINVVNTLTYVLEDGMTCNNTKASVEETKDYILDVPTLSNSAYAFTGWYLEDGTKLADENGKSIAPWDKALGNVNIYAKSEIKLDYEKLDNGTYKVSGSEFTKDLKEITIPASHNGAKVSEVSGFEGHRSLEVVNIPASVEAINAQAFRHLTKIKAVNVLEDSKVESPKYSSVDGVLFTNNGKTLSYFPIASELTEYTVPAKVNEIGDYAFADVSIWTDEYTKTNAYGKLSKITLPKNLTRIGDNAFEYRANLQTVLFTEGGTLDLEFGASAFKSVPLVDFVFPANLKKIGDYCFSPDIETVFAVANFGELVLPEGLEYIGNYAFSGIGYANDEYIRAMYAAVIPASVTHIGDYAFANSKLREITINENSKLKEIPNGFIYNDEDIEEFIIPSTVTKIGNSAFEGTIIMTLDLPNGLEIIGDRAFANNYDLEPMVIPATVKHIGNGAFASTMCSINSLEFAPGNKNFIFEEGVIYDLKKENIILIDKYIDTYVMPDTVKAIPEGLFKYAEFTSLTLSKGLEVIGADAFNGATIPNLVIPASVKTIGKNAFMDITCDSLTIAEGSKLETIEEGAFSGYSFETIALPEGLKTIGANAFEYSSLTSVIIPSTVETIDANAFNGSFALASVTLPKSLKNLGNAAFANTVLKELKISDDALNFKVVDNVLYNKAGSVLAYYPCGLEATKFVVPNGVTEIAAGAFAEAKNITEVVLPTSVKVIGEGAFKKCSSLEKINLEGVIRIDKFAFMESGLKSVTLGKDLKVLSESVFSSCEALATINLENIEVFEKMALNNTRGLVKLVISANAKKVAVDAFDSTKAKEIVVDSQVALDGAITLGFEKLLGLEKLSIKEGLEVSEELNAKLSGFSKTTADGYITYTKAEA